MARFGKQGSPPRLDSAPTSLMPKHSPFLSSSDAPLSKGLVIGWGAFMVFAAVGLAIALRFSTAVPILLDLLPQ